MAPAPKTLKKTFIHQELVARKQWMNEFT